jgi:cytoskeleton protein RodZ
LRQSFEQGEKQASGFGERLRREREMRSISLDDISAATKIGKRLLRALEEEQFDLLPGGIFNKGYVRAYAKYIGIDDDQAVAEYLTAAGETAPDAHEIAEQTASGRLLERVRRDDPDGGSRRFPFVSVLVLFVVIAGAAGGWRLYRERVRERTLNVAEKAGASVPAPAGSAGADKPAPATPTEQAAANGSRAGATTTPVSSEPAQPLSGRPGSTSPPLTTSTTGGPLPAADTVTSNATSAPFEVTVRAKDRAWVSIKSDGKILVQGIIQPPEVKTIRATTQIVFWTGNAGALELSFNGTNIPLRGGANDEQVLVFNSHGLQTRPATQ